MSDLVLNSAGLATWYDKGSIEKKHRQLYDTGYPHDRRADKDSHPHDRRADKDSYPHDRRADKDSYPHDRHKVAVTPG